MEGYKIKWYLLFYLRGIGLLALKTSNVETCGIRGGKLFHVVVILRKKLYLNVYLHVGLVRLETKGCVRELLNFGWRYG